MTDDRHQDETARRELPPGLWRPPRPMGLARTLAKAGQATRREATRMVVAGRVQVDGRVVVDPAFRVEPSSVVLVDGEPLREAVRRYFAFHKPVRVICTRSDHGGQKLVAEFFPPDVAGLAPAGRLDSHTSGLLLVSNDAAWNTAAAQGSQLEKEYLIKVRGPVTALELDIVTAGMQLPSLGHVRPRSAAIVEVDGETTTVRLVVVEARNRQVRRIFSSLRHDVLMVRRVRVGPVKLGDLAVGRLRELSREEVLGIGETGR